MALTKVQSMALIAIIIVAAVVGSAVYFFMNGKTKSRATLK